MASLSYLQPQLERIHARAEALDVPTPVIDTLLDLTVALKGGYRAGARFLMSTLVGAGLFKLKDADGRPLIQPNLQAGFAPTIHGYGLTYAEDMPAAGANPFKENTILAMASFVESSVAAFDA